MADDFRPSPEAGRIGRGRGRRIKTTPTLPAEKENAQPRIRPTSRTRARSTSPLDELERLELQEKIRSVTAILESTHLVTEKEAIGRRGAPRRAKQDFEIRSRPAELGTKQGKDGTPMLLLANYFALLKSCGWVLYQHRVDFNPAEDNVRIRKALVRSQREILGAFIFDGTLLYGTGNLASEETLVLTMEKKIRMDQPEVTKTVEIKIRTVGKVESEDGIYTQFYNLIVRKCLYGMQLEQMGRHFYDQMAAIRVPSHHLELWPGYITSMRAHENGTMLCVEITHKVIRLDNVLTIIKGCNNNRKTALDTVVGTIVITRYNRRPYHVDDINWDLCPRDTFELRKGDSVSYAKYYEERYQVTIKDMTQPMLLVRPGKKDLHKGYTGPLFLVPELCQITGLSEAMRSDFGLMKDISRHLHMAPGNRVRAVNNFMNRLMSNTTLTKELDTWNLKFDQNMAICHGRLIPKENIVFGGPGKPEVPDDKADWTSAFRKREMISSVNLDRWVLFVPTRDAQNVKNLIKSMVNVAKPLGFKIRPPLEVVKVNAPHAYMAVINETIQRHLRNGQLQMLFVILPNNKHELYSNVKHRLSVDLGIPSQCFLAKNVTAKGLMSIATKVVIQMNAKLGGEPWSVQLPLKNLMFVGFDIYRGGKDLHGKSVAALVSTTGSSYATYFSSTSYHKDKQELGKNLNIDITKALQAYQLKSGVLPDRIIFFRDGVGEGDLDYVYETELGELKNSLQTVYAKAGKPMPKFTFIVVTKKIDTRFFTAGQKLDNPPPGTIVDNVVTLPERYDFFLVSAAARQGTVSPCSYNVLYDTQGLDADEIHRITYKMCHMYFNWSGTVAAPAPCQYAHTLATLTGTSLRAPASAAMDNLLHYL